jgi:hypothetical protein
MDDAPTEAQAQPEDKTGPGWTPPTLERAASAAAELIALVEARLPQRFYPSESYWQMIGAAMVVRMADTVKSVLALAEAGLDGDAMILLRALYEQVVVYCWIAIYPDQNVARWISGAEFQQHKLHTETLPFGETVLEGEALRRAEEAEKLPDIAQLAHACDKHWSSRIPGFRAPGLDDVLNFRGLYVAIYRIASRVAHAGPFSLDPYCDYDNDKRRVHLAQHKPTSYPTLVVPLYAQALLVCHHELKWPDPERVNAINNEMYGISQ